MSYFIFDGELECGVQSELKGEEVRHILKARRLRTGDCFLIQDQKGRRFEALLQSFGRDCLTFIPERSVAVPPPSDLHLEILQALPREKALDWILQKTTELGVSRIDLFCATHSPGSLRFSQQEQQLNRWRRIVLEACKQCGRQFPPEIYLHSDLKSALSVLPECTGSWILFPGSAAAECWKNAAAGGKKNDHQRVLIGPEGGFHPDELELASNSGMQPVDLGPRILRTETAAVTAVAVLQFLWGDIS
ncbi:MAG: 16S rRNA (uracil(1498)-N(3))-methyltransferase [SAR324 cluster bacterium]|nr:16S rRNA (uracil(1498)-N(3))-methyltransferase [SAR324 cluster bacterium]MBL7034942.1 16S rRNA (uracil(1498)-N(3))-methyltransferase [SAR324 cluster bacterium]